MANDGKIPTNSSIPAIDPANDVMEIVDVSANATYKVTPYGLFGIVSGAVGLTDTQTLTNKTLTAPTISSPILSGTVTGTFSLPTTTTFPASVVLLTGTQSITGAKTFTNATLTAPTITNASITADAITGFTVSNTGTVYGLAVTLGLLGTTALATNAVQGAQIATNAITLGYAQITSPFTTTTTGSYVTVTGLSITVTVPLGGRGVMLTAFLSGFKTSAAAGTLLNVAITEGSTQLNSTAVQQAVSAYDTAVTVQAYVSAPTAGSHTYIVQIASPAAGTMTVGGGTKTVGDFGASFLYGELK